MQPHPSWTEVQVFFKENNRPPRCQQALLFQRSLFLYLTHTHTVVNTHGLSSVALEMLFMLHQSSSETLLRARHILFILGAAAALRLAPSCEPKEGSCQKA